MSANDEMEPREDIGIGLSAKAWLVIIAGALALLFALSFGVKHFFETRGPAAVYEKQLQLEEEE